LACQDGIVIAVQQLRRRGAPQGAAGTSKALAAQMMEPFATNAPAHAQI
jgi:hypothetical protein